MELLENPPAPLWRQFISTKANMTKVSALTSVSLALPSLQSIDIPLRYSFLQLTSNHYGAGLEGLNEAVASRNCKLDEQDIERR